MGWAWEPTQRTVIKEEMKQIITRIGEGKTLAKMFGVCQKTVIEALKFRSDSELARRIRRTAIERGGKETEYVT